MSFFKRFNYRHYQRIADKWINSTQGMRFRFGVLGATVALPTVCMLMMDGPLLGLTFKRRYPTDYDLPESLRKVVDKEYERWLMSANKSPSESSAEFSCQSDASSTLDSITKGSLSVRFGSQVALPFYARFRDEDEALDYCKKKLEPFHFLGKTLCILWESAAGRELISTFVLSDKALSFLAARDLLAVEPSPSLTNKPTVWATWTTFSSMAAYFMHRKVFNGTALSFVLCYVGTLAMTTFGSMEWHKGYVYLTDSHADNSASRLSSDHSEGGREFYTKFFRRNRILRSLMDSKDAERTFTEAGDIRSATTPYLLRYDLVKDVVIEEQELATPRRGDD